MKYMKSNLIFNKELFAFLLEKARGKRSINQYANETGVSAADISRFLRQMIETPPSPETISKLSSKAHNNVSYKEFMAAAGHIEIDDITNEQIDNINPDLHQSKEYVIEQSSPFERRNQYELIEKKFFQIVLSYLYDAPFNWNIQKPENKHSFPDMIIDIEHEGYKKWYLEFKGSLDERRGSILPTFHIYGQIATLEFHNSDKFTIAVNSESTYNQLIRRPPKSLRVNLYVMLIDLEHGEVISEEKLCTY